MAARHHVDALHEARRVARARQASKACNLPPEGDRQVVEVHIGRQEVHAGLAGEPPAGAHVAARVVARHSDMVTAQRRGRGVGGIARMPPAMGTMDDSVSHLQRPRHHVLPSVIVKLKLPAELFGILRDAVG
eukprot:6159163-Alexandrium_andersonii.AAC.1